VWLAGVFVVGVLGVGGLVEADGGGVVSRIVRDEGWAYLLVGSVVCASVLFAFPVDDAFGECVAGPGAEGDSSWLVSACE